MSTKFAVGDRVEATGKAIWRKDTVGEQGTVIGQGKGSHTYVKMDGPNTDYRAGEKCEVFANEHLKFVGEDLAEWEKELLGIETKQERRALKVGDKVRLLTDGGYKHTLLKAGAVSTVQRVSGGLATVGGWSYYYNSSAAPDELELVVAEKPKTKSQEIEAGDTVRVIDAVGGHGFAVGAVLTVKAVEDPEDGKFAMVVLDSPGARKAGYAKRFELVSKAVVEVEKPKARSQEITLEDVQKGDLIVAFWDHEGVELRRKGVAHENDGDDDWMTKEGAYLTYDDALDSAEHIYLLERPEPKGFDALDKSKTYYLKHYQGELDWYLAFGEGEWRYGNLGNIVTRAYTFEEQFTVGESAWEKPVEYVEPPKTDLELYTEAGYVGNIYVRPNNTPYKVTEEGKVMAWYKDTDKWTNISWDYETFHRSMEAGAFTKIS